jgi:hypothetical protein
MRSLSVMLVMGVCAAGCSKGSPASNGRPAAPVAASPEFDQKWSALAARDVEAFYIEDDRGEGLMGNVRRAKHGQTLALAAPAARPAAPEVVDPNAPPETLDPEEMQRVIRQNLAGVRACFMRMSHDGDARSGKAIVSFQVGAAGDVRETTVDAPSFQGTSLPGCVRGMVSHWSFPKSQKGGLAISYPFVFLGG